MALYPLDEEDAMDVRMAVREFCTLGFFAAGLFGLVLLAHGLVS